MSHLLRFSVGLLLVAACFACQQRQPKSMTDQLGLTMTEPELRQNIVQLRAQILGEFESLANAMIEDSNDPDLRTLAIALKIRVNEEVILATLHPDPAVSLIDLWALTVQLRDYVRKDEVAERYAEFYPELIESIDRTYDAIVELASELSIDEQRFINANELVTEYAEQNPLPGRLWRPSPTPLLAAYRERTGGGLFGDVKSLNSSVEDISNRLAIMTTQLPKQILWHTDLLIQTRLEDFSLDDLSGQVEQLGAAVQDVPDEIERHRIETLADIDRQRRETIEAMDAEFDETMNQISEQRISTLADIDAQRLDTLEHINTQRTETMDRLDATTDRALAEISVQRIDTLDRIDDTVEAVLENLNSQRDETVIHLERLTADALQQTDHIVIRLVNAVFIRLTALVGLAFVAGVVLIVLWRKVAR